MIILDPHSPKVGRLRPLMDALVSHSFRSLGCWGQYPLLSDFSKLEKWEGAGMEPAVNFFHLGMSVSAYGHTRPACRFDQLRSAPASVVHGGMKLASFPLELGKPLLGKAYTRDAYVPLLCRGISWACAGSMPTPRCAQISVDAQNHLSGHRRNAERGTRNTERGTRNAER
jgi:hypothetical protein